MQTDTGRKGKRVIFHREFILVVSMALVLLGLSCYSWLKTENRFSESERRVLKSFPEVTVENVINGKFMKEIESYCLDQFPFRDGFRSLKAMVSYGILGKKDNNGIYLKEGYFAAGQAGGWDVFEGGFPHAGAVKAHDCGALTVDACHFTDLPCVPRQRRTNLA